MQLFLLYFFLTSGNLTLFQLLCCIGWQRSLLAMIVGLPFDFFLSDLFKHSVTPVLITILHRSPMALDIIQSEFDRNHVVSYLKVNHFIYLLCSFTNHSFVGSVTVLRTLCMDILFVFFMKGVLGIGERVLGSSVFQK